MVDKPQPDNKHEHIKENINKCHQIGQVRPHHAGKALLSLLTTMAWNTA